MLATSLGSINESSFDDYELLVADDGSPDHEGIRQTAASYDAKLVRLPIARGLAAARKRSGSRGLWRSTGLPGCRLHRS